jgi:NAD-dependent SIR2 family protein deacetylase
MSLGYADRLSFREDLGGRLGAPELFDDAPRTLAAALRLADYVRASSRVVAFTGAGISTACGIPDFRGPNGVWTLQRAGRSPPRLHTSFVFAKPSLTHMVRFACWFRSVVFGLCITAAAVWAFEAPLPTNLVSHTSPQALVALMRAGKLTYICSQNVE